MGFLRAVLALVLALGVACLASPVGAHLPLDEKEALVEKALEERGEDPQLHLRRAVLHRQRRQWDAAAASYLRAAALGADQNQVEVALAQVFLDAGLPLTAEMQIERVVARAPTDATALITRARVRRTLGQRDGAADDFERAVALLQHPDPDVVRDAMDAQVAAGRPEAALAVADAAMKRIGPVVSIQLPAIEVELARGRSEAALGRLDVLLAQAPRHEVWLAQRGDILENMGRPDEARSAYAQALALIRERPAGRRSEKIAELERRLEEKLADRRPALPR
jgi:Tfp pilus assembly protein PilF